MGLYFSLKKLLFPSNKTVFNHHHSKLVISVHVDSDPEYPYERDGTACKMHAQGYFLENAHSNVQMKTKTLPRYSSVYAGCVKRCHVYRQ